MQARFVQGGEADVNSLDLTQLIALAAVLGFASGIRLYAVLLIVGLVGYAGWMDLPSGLSILQHPFVLIAAGVMFLVEFVADKIPGVDSLWDGIQTFIRIPAGAALAAGVFGGLDSAAWTTAAAILGGSLAATSHFTKAGTRAAANTSPEPFSNVALSVAEDVAAVHGARVVEVLGLDRAGIAADGGAPVLAPSIAHDINARRPSA